MFRFCLLVSVFCLGLVYLFDVFIKCQHSIVLIMSCTCCLFSLYIHTTVFVMYMLHLPTCTMQHVCFYMRHLFVSAMQHMQRCMYHAACLLLHASFVCLCHAAHALSLHAPHIHVQHTCMLSVCDLLCALLSVVVLSSLVS